MKCILISEENHGAIGVAADYKSAIMWLIKEGWLDDYTTFTINNKYIFMKDLQPNWRSFLFTLNINNLKELFDGMFYFQEIEFYNAAD